MLLIPSAFAFNIALKEESTPYTGVTYQRYHIESPDTDVYVMRIDLCSSYIHVDATKPTSSTQSTGSWAADQGVQIATNGDFYKTDPLRVYGNAVGEGVHWSDYATGDDTDYAGEWYYDHYGWIAFGPDSVEFTHTGWVKDNAADLGITQGYGGSDKHPEPPPGTISLVSGFPELVVEGRVMVCSDPEASDCFPDRSDMRDRHPRTAMGITQDKQTFFLVVADGRTSDNDGLYGSELAEVMGMLGAWEAFNLDGGGSSQLYQEGEGYINDYDGNNYGDGARSVANHWGIFAGSGSGMPARPGHCVSAAPCGVIPPEGGIIDNQDACFGKFGRSQYWREESAGYNGHLYWTNAFESDYPDNWAWWQLYFEEAGQYQVELYADPSWSVYEKVRYEVMAGSVSDEIVADPTGSGWVVLGTWDFAAGGQQWLAQFDNYGSNVDSDQHIVADAIRLTRVGGWCGDGVCEEGCDCPEDCAGPEEIPANGVDDDCDGAVDEGVGGDSPPESVSESGPDFGESVVWESGGGEGLAGTVTPLAEGGCGCSGGGAAGVLVLLPWWVGRKRTAVR